MKRIQFLGLAFFFVFLGGCGSGAPDLASTQQDPAKVQLQIPDAATPDDFWSGVDTQDLIWRENGSNAEQEVPIEAGATAPVDFSKGGHLKMEGRSRGGLVLVRGETPVTGWDPKVGQPKVILISLHRSGYN